MITPSAILFATVALSAISSLGAPIPKVARDVVGPETQPIGRRFPQPIAADSPELVKKSVENPPSAEDLVRRFPRRVYYEYYNKRNVEVVERSPEPAPEPAPVPEPAPAPIPAPAPAVTEPKPRSLEDVAREELAARAQRRTTRRRSTDKTHYKRTLASEGVRVRSPREEPRSQRRATNDAMKQAREVPVPIVAREPAPAPAPIVAREPTPAPVPEPVAVKESRAFIPPLEKRDSMIPPPIKESRAFIPRTPDAVDPRDTYIWEINNGVTVNVDVSDVEVTKVKCMVSGAASGSACPSSPANGQNGTPSTTASTGDTTSTTTASSSTTGTSTGSSTTGTSTGSSTTGSSTTGSSMTGSSSTNPADPAGGKGGKGSSGTGSTTTTTTTTTSPSSTSTSTSTPCTGECATTGPNMSGTKKTPTVNTPETINPNPESTNPSPRDVSEGPAPPSRRASAKWRRIVPAPSLSRRTKSGSAIQFRREH